MKLSQIKEELIIRYFSGNITEEERLTLLAWINESHENERNLFLMKDIYDSIGASQLYEEASTSEGWSKLKEMMAQKEASIFTKESFSSIRLHWKEYFGKYAAVLIIGLITGMLSMYFLSKFSIVSTSTYTAGIYEIRTEKGEQVLVTLPDGSTVKLNACSFLSYTSDYGKETRNLKFIGEGYFDVQTNPEMPFVVQTSGLNIKAYGTAFNIKAYEEEDAIETTLVEGKVAIENEFNQQIIELKPNQMFTILKKIISAKNIDESSSIENETIGPKTTEQIKQSAQKAVLKDKIDPAVYVSWKDDFWILKSENLESLAKKIERKYNVIFSFKDEESKKYIFSGTLKDYPLEQILEVIKLNAPIQYTIKEKNVIICEDNQLKQRYKQLLN